jgi:hypothetical protein
VWTAQFDEITGGLESLRLEAAGERILNLNIDKDEMRSYLLGTLDSDLRTQWEERLLCEPEMYEELLVIEQELIDQYLAGDLSKLEQRQFETHFLTTAERQKDLRFGRLLQKYITAHPVLATSEDSQLSFRQIEITPTPRSFPFSLPAFGRRQVLVFAAAILVFGVVVYAWFASRTERLIPHLNVPEVAVSLMPGTVRSDGATMTRLQVPPKGYNVKLELSLTNHNYKKYKSELFRENESLQTTDDLKAEAKGDHHIVPLTVRGDMLSPGDYQVRLIGVSDSGADEFIDNYSFRVIE